ncbi:hypothetical protein DYB38_007547 [Aphanomyces astaci]|uniref:SGNH hydrolase-type esterase domain-containing protein n=1 Tax=Aphanomyces astaci TaxID=112090 RepID=A0A397DW10_APHAT|nr:hypothetical protein DYB38_007547 [Aphanomyces astaci]
MSYRVNAIGAPITLVTIGDSITLFGSIVDDSGWVWMLEQDYKPSSGKVVNRGIGGWTSRRWAPHLAHDILEWGGAPTPPDLVTICLGANDAVLPALDPGLQHVDVHEYVAYLDQMVAHLHSTFPSCKVLLITPPAVNNALTFESAQPTAGSLRENNETGRYAAAMVALGEYVASEHTKTVEGMVRCTSQALTALEKKLHALGIVCHSTRRDIVEMKAPFLTEVANLKAENNAILHEIRRQQDVSRELVLDYKDYVDQHDANPLKPQKPVSARRPHSSVTPVNLTKRFGVVPDCHPPVIASVSTVPPSMAVAVAIGRVTRRPPPPSTSDDNGDDGHDHCGDLFAVGCIDPVENAFLLSKSPVGYQSNVLENNNTIE